VSLALYPVVEDMLRQIMALSFTRGNTDVGAERDFFDRLPPGSIDTEVAQAYDAYCRARGRRGTATAAQLDGFVLAAAKSRFLKVARIIADVLTVCEREQLATNEHVIAGRIHVLVDRGALAAQGNLSKWRFSEVRLTDAPLS
jgi:hypothetical protein